MVPSAAVVARPGSGITLSTRVSGAGQNEGALVRAQLAQTFVCGTGVFHPKNVVDGAVIEGSAIVEAVTRLERHGFIRALEKGRFVHVIPKTRDTHGEEILVETAPPVSRPRKCKIGENALARPHNPHVR